MARSGSASEAPREPSGRAPSLSRDIEYSYGEGAHRPKFKFSEADAGRPGRGGTAVLNLVPADFGAWILNLVVRCRRQHRARGTRPKLYKFTGTSSLAS
eukprot:SAG31_NODE_14322_length_814_cov_0.932867_1_plen_99_part_00